MAIWNKYFWKQPAALSCRSVIASSIRNIFAMCCEQVAPPRYSSAGSSSELTEDYCEQYSDLFRPGEYGVSQQPGTSSCTSLTSCLVLCMSSSRLYPVLSDYFQLYWCLASIKYKIDNFILTFKHDSLNWSYALFSEEPEARRASEGGSMISARDPLQGRALGVPPGHGEVLIIIIVVCEGRPVNPNVVCSSQLHVEVRLDTAPHIANCPKF